MKIVVLGCGTRFTTVYYDILTKLKHDVFLWNRTYEKSCQFCKNNKCNLVKNIEDIKTIKPDLVLCLTSPNSHFEVANKILPLSLGCSILLETPATNNRLVDAKLGVLEQWIKLPLEQFKEMVFSSGLMARPYMVNNDGRSFDYHAVAQLRAYMSFPTPVIIKGILKRYDNPGVLDTSGNMNNKPHEWTLGHIEMSDGSILNYSFSRTCKSLLSIPMQLLRSLSQDGAITTGRMREIGNDYEIMDFRLVDKSSKKVEICTPVVKRLENVTHSISLKDLVWNNPYAELKFDDQQTAIATLVTEGLNRKIYPYKESFIDGACVNMMRQSGTTQQAINYTKK